MIFRANIRMGLDIEVDDNANTKDARDLFYDILIEQLSEDDRVKDLRACDIQIVDCRRVNDDE